MSALPYDFYPGVLRAITLISQGQTKTRACDTALVPVQTFDSYVKENMQLGALFMEAEVRGRDAMADALLQPANHLQYGETNPQMAKIVSDNIKWYLSKKDPKSYGERIEIKHEITLDRAITDAMDRAKARIHGTNMIEHDPKEMMPAALTTSIISNVVHAVSEDDEIMAEILG